MLRRVQTLKLRSHRPLACLACFVQYLRQNFTHWPRFRQNWLCVTVSTCITFRTTTLASHVSMSATFCSRRILLRQVRLLSHATSSLYALSTQDSLSLRLAHVFVTFYLASLRNYALLVLLMHTTLSLRVTHVSYLNIRRGYVFTTLISRKQKSHHLNRFKWWLVLFTHLSSSILCLRLLRTVYAFSYVHPYLCVNCAGARCDRSFI